jgi:hypothetical protein
MRSYGARLAFAPALAVGLALALMLNPASGAAVEAGAYSVPGLVEAVHYPVAPYPWYRSWSYSRPLEWRRGFAGWGRRSYLRFGDYRLRGWGPWVPYANWRLSRSSYRYYGPQWTDDAFPRRWRRRY